MAGGVQLYGPGGLGILANSPGGIAQEVIALAIDVEALKAAPFYMPGSVDVVDGEAVVTYRSRWGLRDDGSAYYDDAGAAAGEEAILSVDEGVLTLTRLDGAS